MDWKKILGTVAPTIAKALPGPFGSFASDAIARALNVKEGDDLAARVQNLTAEDLVKIKEAESGFLIEMRKLDVDLDRLEVEDRASARGREVATHDKMPLVLALMVTLGFFGLLAAMMAFRAPPENASAMNIMLGALATAFASVVGYYFGSSAGSRNKDATISTSLSRKL